MDARTCMTALSALGHETRLEVFRLLVKVGREGLLAGEIGGALSVRQNTLSTNLAILHRAGLVRSEREGRGIRYFADMDGMRALLGFLLEDCCGGRPDLCRPLVDEIACAC
jgi:DNA-binding transcriptional ArsR family regulator